MADFTGLEEDEDINQAQANESQLAGPVSTSGGMSGTGTQRNIGAQTGGNSTPSRFVEFERYFNANKGAADGMANRLASGVETQANAAQAGLQTEQTNFQNQVNEGIQQPTIRPGTYGQYTATPGQYQGPKQFTPSEEVRSNVTNAYSELSNLRTPGGVQTAVSEWSAQNPTNTIGNDRFNANLTSRAGQDRFNSLWDRYSSLGSAVDNSMTGANQIVDYAQETQDRLNTQAADLAPEINQAEQNYMNEQNQIGDTADRVLEEDSPKKNKRRRNILAD